MRLLLSSRTKVCFQTILQMGKPRLRDGKGDPTKVTLSQEQKPGPGLSPRRWESRCALLGRGRDPLPAERALLGRLNAPLPQFLHYSLSGGGQTRQQASRAPADTGRRHSDSRRLLDWDGGSFPRAAPQPFKSWSSGSSLSAFYWNGSGLLLPSSRIDYSGCRLNRPGAATAQARRRPTRKAEERSWDAAGRVGGGERVDQ